MGMGTAVLAIAVMAGSCKRHDENAIVIQDAESVYRRSVAYRELCEPTREEQIATKFALTSFALCDWVNDDRAFGNLTFHGRARLAQWGERIKLRGAARQVAAWAAAKTDDDRVAIVLGLCRQKVDAQYGEKWQREEGEALFAEDTLPDKLRAKFSRKNVDSNRP